MKMLICGVERSRCAKLGSSIFHTLTGPHVLLRISVTFYKQMTFLPRRKHIYSPPRPVMGLALLFHVQMMFVPHTKHTYRPSLPVTTGPLLFYILTLLKLKGSI
jgi:hypothetical protein